MCEMCGDFLEYTNFSGKTAVYGIIGDPIDHVISPLIQNAAFQSAGIDAVYVPFHVRKSSLRSAIDGLRSLGIRGFNVTAPHKLQVMHCLDNLDHLAVEIGAVNTVLNENGSLCGYNTDGLGALKALEEAGATIEGRSCLLFGAGGASRAIAHTLASHVESIIIVNRTVAKARQLERRLQRNFRIKTKTLSLTSGTLRHFIEESDLIVNASSMGMNGRANPPVKSGWFRKEQYVFDCVYKPVETKLLKLAADNDARTINGLDLVVNQGACSFELWTRRAAPITEMRKSIAQSMLERTRGKSR
jgi:shikimate dehydrogenase